MTLAPAIFIQGPLTLAASLDTLADRLAAGDVLDLPVSSPIEAVDDDLAELAAATQRVVAAVQRSHALEAAVHELFEAMSSHLRLDYLSYEALYRVIDHTRAAGGAVVLTAHPLDVVASVDFALEDEELQGLVDQALCDPGPSQLAVGSGLPVVAVPFSAGAGPLGAVVLLGVELDVEMRRLLSLLARALGFAVSNAIAHAAAETQAATDALTGCANRRAGLQSLEQAARVAAHGGPTVGVLMLDLDHFKNVNDKHGHPVGDEVLRTTAAAISAGLRSSDTVVRYGGEEFLVALTGADAPTLQMLAERVADRIRALVVPAADGAVVRPTASIGVAAWDAADDVRSLVARADRALYAAKAAGRDRVVVGPP